MSKKNYNFDGHKLMYHPERVTMYLEHGDCYPLYMEISPVGICNHRCIFCAYDFIGYPNRKLEKNRTLKLLDELAECGLKSILFAGEGEPLIHPDIAEFILHARNNGIDVGLFTNGQLLKQELAEKILPSLTLIRFSFNGGTPQNYADIHSVNCDVFDNVVKNIKNTVLIKQQSGLQVDIGAQFVLIPENQKYLIDATEILGKSGIDYFAVKPFVQQSHLQRYQMDVAHTPDFFTKSLQTIETLSTDTFAVVSRRESFEDYGKRSYSHCYGTPFISVLNSAGDVATCLPYWDKKDFIFGNIYQNSFQEIWQAERRIIIKELLENKLDVSNCPPNCRPNCINEFLYLIKNQKVKHINFI